MGGEGRGGGKAGSIEVFPPTPTPPVFPCLGAAKSLRAFLRLLAPVSLAREGKERSGWQEGFFMLQEKTFGN